MTDAELVAELTARRDFHRAKAAQLDSALAALNDDNRGGASRKKPGKPKVEGEQRPRPTSAAGSRSGPDPATVAEAKKLYQGGKGLSVKAIALQLGKPYGTVYGWLTK